MNDDRKLWEDFRKGKEYALSDIYYKNIKPLYRYGKKFTGDNELVKDTIQELFFDLIRTRKNLKSTDNILLYLSVSLRRKLICKLRVQKKNLLLEDIDHSDALAVYSCEEELISKENITRNEELILNAVDNISPKQREILYYRFDCGFEYEKICKIMSINYDSARKMVYRALKSLRVHLNVTDFML